jgi:ElaA protein
MARALGLIEAVWPHVDVRISAQTHLEAFYASFGFVAVGSPYLEDDIEHTEMLRAADSASTDRGG